jgi:U3 small nucleolar RNA-associated protein 25
MRGGKRGHSGRGGGSRPPFKKKKMSKKFWQQRQTAQISAPIDENEAKSSSEDEDEIIPPSNYDKLLNVFATSIKQNTAVESDDDVEEEEEEDTDNDEHVTEEEEEKEVAHLEDQNLESSESDQEDPENVVNSDENDDKAEEMIEGSDEDDESDDDSPDPFVAKHELEIPDELKTIIEQKDFSRQNVNWSSLGRFLVQTPKKWQLPKNKSSPKKKALLLLDDDDEDADETRVKLLKSQAGLVNYLSLAKCKSKKNLKDFNLKQQIADNVAVGNVKNLDSDLTKGSMTSLQFELLTLMSSYKDVYFSQQNFGNLEQIRFTYVTHALNHMLKTRSKILKNNEKLSKNKNCNQDVRDQGLVRPKVIIVVPFKESAKKIIDLMGKLLFSEVKGGNVSNKKRLEDFGSDPQVDLDKIKETGKKSDDFYDTFAGNIDDGFKIGLAVTKKTLKLYTDFYSSDIIIASPLGLRMVIGVEGEEKRDHDFLASIEMLIFDQMDIMAMQNWDHIIQIMENLHLQPAKSHGVDFSRVRMWTLNGLAKLYRQTLMFSAMPMPEMSAILSKYCHNYTGNVRMANPFATGIVSSIGKYP